MFVEQRDGLDALEVVKQAVMLIGRVDRVGVKAEAHQDCFQAEDAFETGDNRNGAPAAWRERTAYQFTARVRT